MTKPSPNMITHFTGTACSRHLRRARFTLLSPAIDPLGYLDFSRIKELRVADHLPGTGVRASVRAEPRPGSALAARTDGTLNASLVHPREVFRDVIKHSAAQVIIAHNHPSGDPEPSESDLDITKRLSEAGKILGIEIIDHIIITKTGFFSFKDKGLM